MHLELLQLSLGWHILHVLVIGVHEYQHALNIDVLNSLDIQNGIVLRASLSIDSFTVGPDAHRLVPIIIPSILVHIVIVILLLLLRVLYQLRNLSESSIVSIVR